MKRQEVGRVSVRAHIVLLSSRGRSAPKIAEIYDVTTPTVYKWMDRFDEEGPPGLYDQEREGRPPKIDEEVEEEIQHLLEERPTDEGENRTRWTTDRIAEHLERELGVDVHPETVREALAELEYSWTRPRRELPPVDPKAYRKRLSAIVEAVSKAEEETSILVEDETILKRFPPLRRMWQPIGEQRRVWIPEQNDDFTLYGTLELTSGETYVRAFEKGLSEHTIEHLESLLDKVEGKMILIWDQASWHTSGQVTDWLAETSRIETYLLPVRSPRTNPMEDLWRELKEQVAACLERSLDALLESCEEYFEALSPKQTLHTAGLYLN